jgi:membrane protease YdiL (CAAX protease family)
VNARAPDAGSERTHPLQVVAVVGGATALLLTRTWLPVLGSTGPVPATALLVAAVLAASLAVPPRPGVARVHPTLVLAVGLAAIVLALSAGGTPVPAPYSTWALPLAVLAAVAEEALFRRTAYDALEPRGVVVAIGVTAVLFAIVHVPLYGVAVFPVDLGAGLVLGWQRWAAGTWTVPATTHAAANVVMTVLR